MNWVFVADQRFSPSPSEFFGSFMDQMYEQRWEFRRKDGDLETSSEEKESSSPRGRTLNKSEEEPIHSHEPNPPKEVAKRQRKSGKNTQNKRPKKSNQNRGPRSRKTEKESNKIGNKSNIDSSLNGLETHVNVLVKELNASREGFMKWMDDEMEKLIAGNVNSKPSNMVKNKREIELLNKFSKKKIPNGGLLERNKAIQTPTVLALADNSSKAKNSMVLSSANTNRTTVASTYLNMANLIPRPLAENYLVKANAGTLRVQPVVLNGHQQQQQQSGGYYQGINMQSNRDLSGSMGSYGAFIPSISTSHMGLRGGFNVRDLGLSGSETLAQDNNFPS